MPVAFEDVELAAFNHFFELSPRMAVGYGLHDYDGKLPDLSSARIREWSRLTHELLDKTRTIGKTGLGSGRRLDVICLENMLERTLFDIEELRVYNTRPGLYGWQLSAVIYTSKDYAPVDQRIRALAEHLRNVPNFLEQAERNLDRTLPKPIHDVAITQISGVLKDLEGQATLEASKASVKVQKDFMDSRRTAEPAIREFTEKLKKRNTTQDFALGREKFGKVLRINDKLDQTVEEVLEQGLADLKLNLKRFKNAAEKLGHGKSLEHATEMVQSDHPLAENLVSETAKLLDELKSFLAAKNIVSLPGKTNCRVVPTPAQMRATTTAAMSSPGPFEKKPDLEGLYYVTPVEEDWDAKRKEEWLRHLNYSTLRDISSHEVFPGHYTHRMFINSHATSMTKKCYWNNAFGEGWAHYTEEMMVEQGYGDLRVQFMVWKEALLRDCRFIVSFKMHTQGMTVEEAKKFIMNNAYMTEQPAAREALRGTFDHSYYGYTLGKLYIKRAREKFLKANPSASLRSFHDRLLSLGSAPVGLLEDLILT